MHGFLFVFFCTSTFVCVPQNEMHTNPTQNDGGGVEEEAEVEKE